MCYYSLVKLLLETAANTTYRKTSLNRSTIGLTLNGPFRELEYHYNSIVWAIIWDPNIVTDNRGWSICGGGQLERFYCIIAVITVIITSYCFERITIISTITTYCLLRLEILATSKII